LRETYEIWCKEGGYEPLGAKRFAGRLRERGVCNLSVRTNDGPRDGWKGVKLSTDTEKMARQAWGTASVVSSDVVVGFPSVDTEHAHANRLNGELQTTSHYSLQGKQEDFVDYLEAVGIKDDAGR
jgi:phosphosulfolactate synthase (CoM biosynthesis protein A)